MALRAGLTLFLSISFLTTCIAAEVRSIDIEHDGERYRLVSTSHFDASREDVYAALIDYDRLTEISAAIEDSHYLDATDAGLPLVYTRIGACMLFFCKTVEKVERLEADRPCYIATTALPAQSNVRYSRSEWLLTQADDGGTRVIYRLGFEPDFWVPPFIGPYVIRKMLRKEGVAAVQVIEDMARRHAATRKTNDASTRPKSATACSP